MPERNAEVMKKGQDYNFFFQYTIETCENKSTNIEAANKNCTSVQDKTLQVQLKQKGLT